MISGWLTKASENPTPASSPDGRLIVFASNRHAYSEPLSAEAKALFDRDPSSQIDIYVMNADGTNVRRLTTSSGYDGGPFFSVDGKRICWRRPRSWRSKSVSIPVRRSTS